eukprot:gene1695-464_t
MKEIEIKRSHLNKPYIISNDLPNLNFNISHSGDCVVYVICDENPVGIDVEKVEKKPKNCSDEDFFSYFTHCFTKKEWQEIKKLDDFFTYWTLKESFIKTSGLGIRIFYPKRKKFTIQNDEIK